MSYDVIVSGHICLDLIPQISHLSPEALHAPGKLFEAGPMIISTGGPVSNTGLTLHRLGVRVGLMAAVGDDLIGQIILSALKAQDPRLGELITVQPGVFSSYSVVLSPGGADRTFLHYTGHNATFSSSHVNSDQLRGAKVFHLGYPPLLPRLIANEGEGLAAIYQQAKAAGLVTSMDMVVPDPQGPSGQADWQRILSRVLPYVDVFLPSVEEILFMLRRADLERWGDAPVSRLDKSYLHALGDEMLMMGARICGVKLGTYGLYLRTASRSDILISLGVDSAAWNGFEGWQPAFAVQNRGTTGAGDAAIAGFLTALLHHCQPEEALRWANAVGACCVESPDSIGGIQPLDETLERLRAGWQVRSERIPGF